MSRAGEQKHLDPSLLHLLAVHSNGATTQELAMYMEVSRRDIGPRLEALRASGRIVSLPNPQDTHQLLWALPQDHLTQAPIKHRAPQHLRGLAR